MRFLQPLLLAATAASLGFEPLPQWPLEFSANFTSPSSAKNTSGFWASSSEHRSEVLRFQAVGLQGSTTDEMVTSSSLSLLT